MLFVLAPLAPARAHTAHWAHSSRTTCTSRSATCTCLFRGEPADSGTIPCSQSATATGTQPTIPACPTAAARPEATTRAPAHIAARTKSTARHKSRAEPCVPRPEPGVVATRIAEPRVVAT